MTHLSLYGNRVCPSVKWHFHRPMMAVKFDLLYAQKICQKFIENGYLPKNFFACFCSSMVTGTLRQRFVPVVDEANDPNVNLRSHAHEHAVV